MARMVRKQICIDDDLDQRLESLAGSLRVSQSQVVRNALAAYFESDEVERQRRIEAMDRFLKLGEEIGKRLPPDYRRLTREEAHDRQLLRRLEHTDLHAREDTQERDR